LVEKTTAPLIYMAEGNLNQVNRAKTAAAEYKSVAAPIEAYARSLTSGAVNGFFMLK